MCVVWCLYCVPFITLGQLCLTDSSPDLCGSMSGSSFGRDPLKTMLRHLSSEFVPSVPLFTLRACAGPDCTGLGALCFPFLLSWIIPACIPFYLTVPSLDSRGVCAIFSPKSLSQGYMSPIFCHSLWTHHSPSMCQALHTSPVSLIHHSPCCQGHIIPPSFLSPMLGETGDARSYFFPVWEIHYLTAGNTGRAVREGCA